MSEEETEISRKTPILRTNERTNETYYPLLSHHPHHLNSLSRTLSDSLSGLNYAHKDGNEDECCFQQIIIVSFLSPSVSLSIFLSHIQLSLSLISLSLIIQSSINLGSLITNSRNINTIDSLEMQPILVAGHS